MKFRYIISIVFIIAIALITYIYYNKEPVESNPARATLVYENLRPINNEVKT